MVEPELAYVRSLVSDGRAVDVGANKGVYTYEMWRQGWTVEAFEPVPECADLLIDWASVNVSVNVHQVALSSKSGSSELFVPLRPDGRLEDALASLERSSALETRRSILVQTRTLDSFNFDDVRIIKIDVEGHERAVMDGARETIRKCAPVLLIEIEQRHSRDAKITDLFAEIKAIGYSGFYLSNEGRRSIQEFSPDRDQPVGGSVNASNYINNFIFTPAKPNR